MINVFNKLVNVAFVIQDNCFISIDISFVPQIDNYHKIEDIKYFEETKHLRSMNDKANKKRESILVCLSTTYEKHYFFDDKRWENLRQHFYKIMYDIFLDKNEDTEIYDNLLLSLTAGRKHNFDFILTYFCKNVCLYTINVEFKNQSNKNCSIYSLPQLLSISIKNNTFNLFPKNTNYIEFFYHNYLPELISIYKSIDNDFDYDKYTPSLKDYYKIINSTTYTCHPLIQRFYEQKQNVEKEKDKLVNKSIYEYLKTISFVDLDLLYQKLKDSQLNKIYIFWNINKFTTCKLCKDDIEFQSSFALYRCNSIEIQNMKNKRWNILLRWKNYKGILHPALQIKYKN